MAERGYGCSKVQASGCVTVNIPGRSILATRILNVGAIFAVNLVNEILGVFEGPAIPGKPDSKGLHTMTSSNDLLDAFCDRLLFYMQIGVNTWNIGQQLLMECRPDVCNSFLMDEAVERGIDLPRLHKEHDTSPFMVTYGGINAAGYQSLGMACEASADGRLAGTPLDDGSMSPMIGAGKKGPTAVMNSAGKIPFMHMQLMNQRFMPQFLEGDNKQLFANYLRVWHEKGSIPHIQFNVVDSEMLKAAQNNTEEYKDLQVRVAGYCAFWIDLARDTQDSIIARTEQSLS